MNNVNFFESTIDVTLEVHKGGQVAATNHGRTLFGGDQYAVMNKIRRMIDELAGLGDKQVIFTIRTMVTGDTASTSNVKEYLKNNLLRLNTSTPVQIEVKAGIDMYA